MSAEIDFKDLAPTEPTPDDVEREDGYFASWDDTELYWQVWSQGEPDLCIALMHGYGEHSSRYHHVASALARAGYGVMAIDARGHGKSTGKRGHVHEFDHYALDYEEMISRIEDRWPDRPIFSLGHSNGGLIVLRHALREDPRIEGYVVTSPFCGFSLEVPAVKAAAGTLMSRIWPSFTLPTELDPGLVSHDPKVVEDYTNDPLNIDVATARWFTEAKAAQADLKARAAEIDAPFLFLVAGEDGLVDAEAAEEVYHRMGSHDRQFEILPDLYHEVLNEEGWQDLMTQIVDWIEERRPES